MRSESAAVLPLLRIAVAASLMMLAGVLAFFYQAGSEPKEVVPLDWQSTTGILTIVHMALLGAIHLQILPVLRKTTEVPVMRRESPADADADPKPLSKPLVSAILQLALTEAPALLAFVICFLAVQSQAHVSSPVFLNFLSLPLSVVLLWRIRG